MRESVRHCDGCAGLALVSEPGGKDLVLGTSVPGAFPSGDSCSLSSSVGGSLPDRFVGDFRYAHTTGVPSDVVASLMGLGRDAAALRGVEVERDVLEEKLRQIDVLYRQRCVETIGAFSEGEELFLAELGGVLYGDSGVSGSVGEFSGSGLRA